jgi:hypothetical protein
MAKRANRGRGGKKNLKLNKKKLSVDLDDASRFSDCEVDLSTEEVMAAEDVSSSLPVGRDGSIKDVSTKEPIIEVGVSTGCLDMDPGKVDQMNFVQDWRSLFQSEKTLGALKYFSPTSEDGRIVVKPPKVAIEEGILKLSPSLVGQFLDKPLPFYAVKRTVDSLWGQYGKVEVFLLENGLYLFQFVDIKARDEVMEAKLWHIANKPLILRKWTQVCSYLRYLYLLYLFGLRCITCLLNSGILHV